ncbi:hypothetical protein GCM10010232_55260 [Streptomyces amakusaensis]
MEGTVTPFEVWWTDRPRQIRLKPVDPDFLGGDWAAYLAQWRPGRPAEIGQPTGPAG